MKRVIITGATGFIGANLARRLLKEGHDINLLVRSGYSGWRIKQIQHDVKLYNVNLEDEESSLSVINKIKPEWIFHLAVYGAYPHQTDMGRMARTNIMGTVNLIKACLRSGFESFINTGSSSEYGLKDNAPSENEYLEPNSYYAVTKSSATLFCRYTAQSQRLYMPTLRLYSAYGPYEQCGRLIPTLILCGLLNKLPSLVNPDIARDFVYIDDVIEAYLLAAIKKTDDPGAIYNVGTGVQSSLFEVVKAVKDIMGIGAEPDWNSMQERPWDTNTWQCDNRKIVQELSWQPKHTFVSGFRKTLEWFKDNPELLDFYRKSSCLDAK